MTERLSSLLQAEAEALAIPAPTAQRVLALGHARRRRRRVTQGLAATVVAGIVAGGALTLTSYGSDHQRLIEPAGRADYSAGGAYAVGSRIHVAGTDTVAEIPGQVKALYYTSVGVVVRHGTDANTDSPGPSDYTLVTPDGLVRTLDLELGDRVPSTEPGAPYLAYADADGSGWAVVVRDVSSDTEVARVHVDGSFTSGGWFAPPVSLSGDTVYVALDDQNAAVDWRTGKVDMQEGRAPGSFGVTGGRVISTGKDDTIRVVDLSSGKELLTYPGDHFAYVTLSPDGRYAKVVLQDETAALKPPDIGEEDGFQVFNLDTGKRTTIRRPAWDLGWTPDGHLIGATKSEVTICAPDTGKCTTTEVDNGAGTIKLGGMSYES